MTLHTASSTPTCTSSTCTPHNPPTGHVAGPMTGAGVLFVVALIIVITLGKKR